MLNLDHNFLEEFSLTLSLDEENFSVILQIHFSFPELLSITVSYKAVHKPLKLLGHFSHHQVCSNIHSWLDKVHYFFIAQFLYSILATTHTLIGCSK